MRTMKSLICIVFALYASVTQADQPPCLQYVVIGGVTTCLVRDVPTLAPTVAEMASDNRLAIERNIAESSDRASQPIRIAPQVTSEFVINPRPTRSIRTDC